MKRFKVGLRVAILSQNEGRERERMRGQETLPISFCISAVAYKIVHLFFCQLCSFLLLLCAISCASLLPFSRNFLETGKEWTTEFGWCDKRHYSM